MNQIIKNKGFLIIFIIAFFTYMSHNMISPTLPKYASILGASATIVGTVSGSFAMVALLVRPFSGQLVDICNKKNLLLLSIGCIMVSTFCLAIVHTPLLLIVFRGLNGLGWGFGSTLCMTIACNFFTKETMNSGIGIYGLGQTIAQAIGPTIGLSFAMMYGYSNLYILDTFLMAIAFILIFLLKNDSHPTQTQNISLRFDEMICKSALLPSLLTACNFFANAAITGFLVLFAETINISNPGIYFTIQALVIFVSRPFLSKLLDKYKIMKVLIPCEIFICLSLIILSISQNNIMFIISAILMGCGVSGSQPALMAECVNHVDIENRGKASNTSYIGQDIGMFLGSNLAGVIVSLLGYRWMYFIIIFPIMITTMIFISHKSKEKYANVDLK